MGSAETLSEKIDALADALRAAGVPPERIASILASAATATMHALVLDALVEETVGGAPNAAPRVQPLRVAA
jgi:hypothetical protein